MGQFDLHGSLSSRSEPADLLNSMEGNLEFESVEGRIYRFGLLAKILALLNVTEIYQGQMPDLIEEGWAYNSMAFKGNFQNGKFITTECALDGASMGIACDGSIDLAEETLDLTILVAPFKTADRIVRFIPFVSNILRGNLISIPFQAQGPLSNPTVIPLPPAAVGSSVLHMMEKTLRLPFDIIQPMLPQTPKNEQSRSEEN